MLTPQEAESLFETLRVMADEGRTIIFISHKLHEVKAVSDRVTVLRDGKTIATVATADGDAAVARGADGRARGRRSRAARRARRARSASRCSRSRALRRTATAAATRCAASPDAPRRRDRRVAGVAGQRPARARRGDHRHAAADARRRSCVGGTPLRGGDAREAIRAGVAHVPEDRLHTGVAPSLSIASNVVLKSYRGGDVARGPLLRLRAIREHAAELIGRYDVRGGGPRAARAPALRRQPAEGRARPRVRGRAARAHRRVADARPRRRRDRDRAPLPPRGGGAAASACCSSREDLDEILALADRIAVMYEGAIVGELDAATATVEELGLLMAGGDAA